MVQKSAVSVLALTLVLALSFSAIVTVNSSEADSLGSFDNEDSQPLDSDNKLDNMHEFDDEEERSYEDDFEDEGLESEVNVNLKKIPPLKMKGMAVQTLKFKFW